MRLSLWHIEKILDWHAHLTNNHALFGHKLGYSIDVGHDCYQLRGVDGELCVHPGGLQGQAMQSNQEDFVCKTCWNQDVDPEFCGVFLVTRSRALIGNKTDQTVLTKK